MSGHTPGPWAVSRTIAPVRTTSGALVTYIEQGTAGLIAVEDGREADVADANARLIAAAPDMLAALENIARNCEEPEAVHCARAAIAKARGES